MGVIVAEGVHGQTPLPRSTFSHTPFYWEGTTRRLKTTLVWGAGPRGSSWVPTGFHGRFFQALFRLENYRFYAFLGAFWGGKNIEAAVGFGRFRSQERRTRKPRDELHRSGSLEKRLPSTAISAAEYRISNAPHLERSDATGENAPIMRRGSPRVLLGLCGFLRTPLPGAFPP